MADLEPIGVQAVVEGLDTFTSEMGAMQGAIEQTGQSAEAGGEGLEQMGNVVGDILQARMIENLITQLEDLATNALTALISNAGEAEQVEARLDATLRALGDSAAVTKEQAIGLADSIMGLSTFEDEAVIAAETMLLRFTSIGQDIFPQALQASTDLAAGLGMDLTSAARVLGMALESPADGMSRLRRMGVMFTEEQQNTIKAMQEAGDAAGAQALMLDILNSKFGGTAAAMADTYQGRMEQLKNTLGNLQETIGTMLLPTLTELAESLNTALSDPLMQKLAVAGGAIAAIGAAAIFALPKIVSFVSAIKQIQVALAAFSVASGGASTALAGLTALLANPLVLAVLAATAVIVGLTVAVIANETANRNAAQAAADMAVQNEKAAETYNLALQRNAAALDAMAGPQQRYLDALTAADVADYNRVAALAATDRAVLTTIRSDLAYIDSLTAAERATLAENEAAGLMVTSLDLATLELWRHSLAVYDTIGALTNLAGADLSEAKAQEESRQIREAAANAITNYTQATSSAAVTAEALAAAIRKEQSALELLQSGASYAETVLIEIARAEAAAGDEALTAADKALIYYDALMRVATAERTARINEASAIAESTILLSELTIGYEEAGAAGVASADSVAQRYREMEIERSENARMAALDIKYWHEDQNEWILDNEVGLTEALQQEFLARTEAARAQADIVKEDNAGLAMEILSAEQDYQRQKAEIMQIADEGQRAAALAILERENGERIARAQERAALEEQIEAEKLRREIANMQTAGAAGGAAMAQSFATEWEKIKGVFDKTGQWAAEGVVLPEEIVADYSAWLGRMRSEVQKNDWTEDQKLAVGVMLDEIEADLNGTTIKTQEDAAAVALAWANAGIDMAAGWQLSTANMMTETDALYERLSMVTTEEWLISLGFEIEGLPEGILPTSPKSRWQKRLEMLDKWTNTHTIGINMEVSEEGGEIGDPLDWIRGQMDFAGKLGGIGDFFGNLYQEEQVDPLVERAESLTARIEELNAALVSGKIDAGMYNKIMYDLTLTEEERARVLAELAEKQERLQRLQEAQQQLDFLQQQMDLLDLIAEYGLNPEDILGGVELGANADIEGILDALTRAMEAIIAQGAGAFPGMEEELPPGGEMMAAPALPAGRAFGMQVTVGPNYINNGMDEALFAARVEQVVVDALAAA